MDSVLSNMAFDDTFNLDKIIERGKDKISKKEADASQMQINKFYDNIKSEHHAE